MQLRLLFPFAIALCAAPATPNELAPVFQPEIAEEGAGTLALDTESTRMTVPVSIGGNAPLPFIIDTGAERSVVSRQLAASLRLDSGPRITLTTMTGNTKVPTVIVPSLSVGPVRDLRAFNAPALEAGHLGAHGLLGIEQLREHMVVIDFDRREMAVRPSRRSGQVLPRASGDEIVVTAKNRLGQLIVTEAEFEGVRTTVVLDTGSQISIGNLALQRRLKRIPLKGPITMTSVTGEQMTVNYHVARNLKLGTVGLNGVPVAFADLAPFERFGLTKRPALMLGMDALHAFRRVEIDFPARRVRFLVPREGRIGMSTRG